MTTPVRTFTGAHLQAADEEWKDVLDASLWLPGFGLDDVPDLSGLGRLLGRLATLAPDSGFKEATGFAFVLRHVERGELIGVVLDDEFHVALTVGDHLDLADASQLARALAAFLDTVSPADCVMPYTTGVGRFAFGVRGGVPFGSPLDEHEHNLDEPRLLG